MDLVLVVYLFAPLGGPGSTDAFDYLRDIWEACGARLGMDRPIGATGAPDTMPASLADIEITTRLPSTGRVLAAKTGRTLEIGKCEALLRLHHELLSLAVRLGPPAREWGWRDLHARWTEACDPSAQATPEGGPSNADVEATDPAPASKEVPLLGSALLYLGLVADLDEPAMADAAVARRLVPALPPGVGNEWVGRGAATYSGYAMWELSDEPEDRATRRIVAVVPRSLERGLSAWLWSRGTAEMTPFGYYLLQTAKIRYLARLWDDGARVRTTRDLLDQMTGQLTRLLSAISATTSLDADVVRADSLADQTNALRRRAGAATATLVAQATEIDDLTDAVEIAKSNVAEALRAEAPTDPSAGLFGDDAAFIDLLVRRLADKRGYGERSLIRARAAEDLAVAILGPLPLAGPGTTLAAALPAAIAAPRRLEGADRQALLDELAAVIYRAEDAVTMLEDVGLPRSVQAQIGSHGALSAWTTNLTDLENGKVADPHGRLVRAALDRYSHNVQFRAAARHLGIPID